MPKIHQLALILGLFLILSTARLEATTVERFTLETLTIRAASIVQGTVTSTQSHWDSRRRIIFTTTTLQVTDGLKGSSSGSIQITTIGGQIGNSIMRVAGMPAFRPGETAIVFAERSGSHMTVLGLGQGKFAVMNGTAENSVAELAFSDGNSGSRAKMSVDSLKSQILAILARQK
jgi:hypothetical protein